MIGEECVLEFFQTLVTAKDSTRKAKTKTKDFKIALEDLRGLQHCYLILERDSIQDTLGLYMGCSDVSEFEHIYGQIVTTPSCVYGRLFT